jgi:very-short-patch-repair endonuclease
VSRHQLRELGYTDQLIKRRILHGRVHRIHRGVYAVGSPRLTLDGRRMAAVLACGEGALLSHRDAGRLHGVLRGAGTGDWHVTATGLHRVPGVRCHVCRDPDPRDATAIAGIPVTSLERTYLDLAPQLSRGRLLDALEEGQRKDIFDLQRLHDTIARSPGHHGLAALRAALPELGDQPPLMRSDNERLLREILRDADLPLAATNVDVAGETVDAVWHRPRLVVEVDSDYGHSLPQDLAEDDRRDAVLRKAGYHVERIIDTRLRTEPERVAAELRTLLAGRSHHGPDSHIRA